MQDLAAAAEYAWRVSPLATARTLSRIDGDKPPFETAPHLKYISDAIVDAKLGNDKRKIILSMPPRHGKSTLVTLWTPQWWLANDPYQTVGICGYGDNFTATWGRVVRNKMIKHSDIFGFTLAQDSKKADVWNTEQGGGLWTAGIKGEITGKGADLFVIDDPVKSADQAFSLIERDNLWRWWEMTAQTRTYAHSVIILVMTRWHTDDLAGRLQSLEYVDDPSQWRVIEMPAIWDQNEPDVLGRQNGEALWPGTPEKPHFTAEFLLSDRKAGMSEDTWLSLYQQKPLNRAGLLSIYKAFDEDRNVRECEYDPSMKIAWSLDFNRDPMTSVIAQVRETHNGNLYQVLSGKKTTLVEVLDEIVLPNALTHDACEEFESRLDKRLHGHPPGTIDVYGDATASRRDTRGDESDWEIVFEFLAKRGYRFNNHVDASNPSVANRANAMNTALRSADGASSLFIDPRCKELRTDLKEVRWKRDSSGNVTSLIDKSDSKRTHVSDALGYLIYQKFGLHYKAGERGGLAR